VLEKDIKIEENLNENNDGMVSWMDEMEKKVEMMEMKDMRKDIINKKKERNEMFVK
jgi:hypothetical protein